MVSSLTESQRGNSGTVIGERTKSEQGIATRGKFGA